MDISSIQKFLEKENLPKFRLQQIKKAYFVDLVDSWEEIFTLPKDLRDKLSKEFSFSSVSLDKLQSTSPRLRGPGQTQKALLRLSDGMKVESVLMDYPPSSSSAGLRRDFASLRDGWLTACLSTMVGCPLGCLFCATGKMGWQRNLTVEEMVDQIVFWNRLLKPTGKKVSHLVFMGMGEPFLNWENLWQAIEIIQDKDGLNIGDRKISISTAGIVDKINRFSQMNNQINLAISLHSPIQEKRERLMPVAKTNSLDKLMEASLNYVKKTGRKLFFEYALMGGWNDSDEDALALSKLMRKSYLFHLNLIHLNEVVDGLKPSVREREFVAVLDKKHVPYTIRKSFGGEISAACGQLVVQSQ